MSKVRDGNFIAIQSFMVKDLGLKGNELLIYAIIYGFTQDGETYFTGSLQYLADWTNATKQSVINNIKSLCEKGLIEKQEVYHNGVKFCKYKALMAVKNFERGSKEILTPPDKKSLTNNIEQNNIDDNIEKEPKKPQTVSDVILEYTDNETLANALLDFAKMRKAKKKPLNMRQMQLLFDKLLDMATTEKERIAIVNQSVMNGWLDVYPLKDDRSDQPKRGSSVRGRTPSYDIDALQQKANRPDNYVYKKKT